MKRLFLVFIVCFLACAGPGGPLPEGIDSSREIIDLGSEARPSARDHRFSPYLKTTTTMHCLLVGGPVDRESGGGPPVHLHYQNPAISQPTLRLIGTDPGRAFLHQGTNIILFG